MAEPFIAEIRMMSFNFPPKGWALCNGQLLPINQNQALFSLLGTTYGGDGRVNFALPDLRGRVPLHIGAGHTLGEHAGQESHTLTISEMPDHFHTLSGSTVQGNSPNPNFSNVGNVLAPDPGNAYGPPNNATNLNTGSIGNVGGSQPHQNMQPFLTINFSIALQGIFPSQT
ncbi:phage tail protein [Bradyrhizobium sp. WSM 1704]|uniref:phage tail protein n=1 Tax=Bradyrhizobium semiaridum TaxID=2821404 RepID=UPI001CE39C81|nr:tail fiber protein [Bradyrhizobium semiaridum]MCA6125558.1 phage tail protein [Bradyrhizobium semiaridum]